MKVNARDITIAGRVPLLVFLEMEGWNAKYLALELNGEVVPRSRFAEISLTDGDVLEIVCFVGGGI